MERLGLVYDQGLSQERSLYRISSVQIAPVAAPACISEAVTAVCRQAQEQNTGAFQAFGETRPVRQAWDAVICGYDPMNMCRLGNYLLCKHFVFLKGAEEQRNLKGPILLELADGSDAKVLAYYTAPEQG